MINEGGICNKIILFILSRKTTKKSFLFQLKIVKSCKEKFNIDFKWRCWSPSTFKEIQCEGMDFNDFARKGLTTYF